MSFLKSARSAIIKFMAEFKFFCPQCGQHIQCDTSYSGTQIDCPICKQAIVVPQAPRAASAARPTVAAQSRTLRNVLVIAAAVVVLAGLGFVGWYGYSKFKIRKLPPGVVSLWSGEGNANDSVGGNNGTMTGSAKFGPGKVGQGFVFDGDNGSGVMLGNPASLQLQDFTIEAWIKRGSTSMVSQNAPNAEIFSYQLDGYAFGLWDGRLYLSKMGVDNVTLRTGISDTRWHHVAVTKSENEVVFYIDGVVHNVEPYAPTFTFATPAAIGTSPTDNGTQTTFLGSIDEVGIFNRALSASEIRAIYTEEK
jgi:hypothetical protein